MKLLTAILILSFILTGCTGDPEVTITVDDLPTEVDAVRGEVLFNQPLGRAPACNICHNETTPGTPDLTDFGSVASTRVEGISARQYTLESIVSPAKYVVEGYGNAMYNRYIDELSLQDLADLIAYLLEQ